jgi:acyl-CoA synthetase (AMP-forming)/AMP-acid ligase II
VDTIRLRILPVRTGPWPRVSAGTFEPALLPPGSPGEIVVTGEHVLSGYLGGHGDGEHKIDVDGTRWHRTGDAGYLDARGGLWLLGRISAALGGPDSPLYPLAIEAAAHEHAEVRRAAAVEVDGQGVLVFESDGDRDRIAADLSRDLGWAALGAVRAVRRIPVDRRHNAKIDYERLRVSVSGRSWLAPVRALQHTRSRTG